MPKLKHFFVIFPFVLQTLIWPFTRSLFRLFCRLHIESLENLNSLAGGVIFVSNHSSELDPVLVPTSLPFLSSLMPMFYTSREDSYYRHMGWRGFFYGGVFFKALGAYPVYAGQKNYERSLSTHIQILEQGRSVLIFPHGARTTPDQSTYVVSNKPAHVHGGAAFLSHRTGRPIVPIHIEDSYNTTFSQFFFRKKHMKVSFGKPLYPKDIFNDPSNVKIEEYQKAAERAMSKV